MTSDKELAEGMEQFSNEEAKKQKKTIAQQEEELLEKIKKKMRDPNLLVDTIKEVQKEVSGEEDTIVSLIIVGNTRLVENAIPESKNLFLSDKTGIGKDHVTKKTLEVTLPEEKHLHVTKMSPEAFTYWNAFKKDWTWDDKVIHFEDITQSLLNCSTFKTMASGGSFAVVVKEQKTVEIPINGKPVMIPTSHHANPEDEALRRFPIGALNETTKQTRGIKDKIARKYTGRNENTINYVLRSAVQSLEPHSVLIPYAELIQYFFPEDTLMRTHFRRFLDYICSSTVFHQYQREKTEDGKLIATPDDYMIARLVLIYTTFNPKMIPMSKEYRDLLKILQENINSMTVKEIYPKFYKSKDWLYRHLPKLMGTGLVITGNHWDEKANKNITTYQYSISENPMAIPTWNEIGNKIEEIIKNTKKTKKTNTDLLLEKWFSDNKIKPRKPKNNEEDDGFSVVFLSIRIPFNRLVFLVFAVLRDYLRHQDEERYKRYYEEKEPALYDKIEDLKKTINKNRKSGRKIDDDFLSRNFDDVFVSKLKESGQLIKQSNGEYFWG